MKKVKKTFSLEYLNLSLPKNKVLSVSDLFDQDDKIYPLAKIYYEKVKVLYKKIGPRKNGDDSFLHPTNVVNNLKSLTVKNQTTLLTGLLHDYIEELVDVYRDAQKIDDKSEHGKRLLDAYEIRLVTAFEKELTNYCEQFKIPKKVVPEICLVLSLLTRHKRHFYYKSLSFMFTSGSDIKLRERAIQIKLADRMHNIQSIDFFDEAGQLYQCFKNFFILNNTKQFLLELYGKDIFKSESKLTRRGNPNPTERLFNRCAKATYLAYLKICQSATDEGIWEVKWMLELAFKKFKNEYSGIWEVTDLSDEWYHPMKLYFGVVRKFDARLHQEKEAFERHKEKEKIFVKDFFKTFKFSQKRIQAIIDYKDAYSLKEIIAYLLYKDDYVLKTFLAEELTQKGRIRKRKAKRNI